MTQALHRLALSLLALPLAACAAGSGDYPSLAIRDAERVEGSFETGTPAEPPSPPEPPSADLLGRLSQLQAQATDAHRAFLEAAPGARRAVAAAQGASVTTNSYAEAQIALADLDSHRSRAAVALGDLDLLFADATLAFEVRAPIAETRSEVAALIAEEDAILAELRGSL
jgi:hypothetical protein